ncbi:MAG: amidohydrolase family protein [Desulfobacterales bacterium]|nr:amidohydrolase family protein [Desulfobacterales bacterium]
MIIDFHTHIFPGKIRENREKYFPAETAFSLLYSLPKSKLIGAQELIAVMDAQEIDKAVVFGFPWKNPKTLSDHNDYIAESIERFPTRLIGFCCLDPFSEEAVTEAQRCLAGSFSGVGELAYYQSGFDEGSINRLAPIMEICRQADVPVLIHTNKPIGHKYPGKVPMTFPQLYGLIRKFPENKIVLAHWGGGLFFFHLVKKEIKESLQNIYFDTAASPFLYDPKVYSIAVQIVGPEKILFGSDYPLIKPAKYFKEMEAAGLSPDETRRILGKNAAELLKI